MMRVARAHKVIGVPVPADEIADIFHRLGLQAAREGAGANEVFVVTPPSFRFDIEIEEDLIEKSRACTGSSAFRLTRPSRLR